MPYVRSIEQEAQLSQRDRATRYVSWNRVNCCANVRKWHFKSEVVKPVTAKWLYNAARELVR